MAIIMLYCAVSIEKNVVCHLIITFVKLNLLLLQKIWILIIK